MPVRDSPALLWGCLLPTQGAAEASPWSRMGAAEGQCQGRDEKLRELTTLLQTLQVRVDQLDEGGVGLSALVRSVVGQHLKDLGAGGLPGSQVRWGRHSEDGRCARAPGCRWRTSRAGCSLAPAAAWSCHVAPHQSGLGALWVLRDAHSRDSVGGPLWNPPAGGFIEYSPVKDRGPLPSGPTFIFLSSERT